MSGEPTKRPLATNASRRRVPSRPRASIIVPAWRSQATVAACLESLRGQSVEDHEVILVDSSPDEATARVVARRFPEVRLERVGRRLLPHAARNAGVRLARGGALVFTDPDCLARPDWLAQLLAARAEGHRVVLGALELEGAGRFARGVHLCKYHFLLPGLPPGVRRTAGTANACYDREVWAAVGPFEGDRYAGDGLLSWRAARYGWEPWFEPRAVVAHRYLGSLRALCCERRERGADYALARVEHECWSRGRVLVQLAAAPALPALMTARGARDAVRSGWREGLPGGLPVALAGHAAWCLGEARAHARLAGARTRAPV